MTQLNLSLRIPDDLARLAREKGILGSGSMVAMLRRELRRRELNKLTAPVRRLRAKPIAEFGEDQLRDEIRASRQSRRHHADRS